MAANDEHDIQKDTAAPTMPRQADGRHDAFDIYAEIYAIRLEAERSS